MATSKKAEVVNMFPVAEGAGTDMTVADLAQDLIEAGNAVAEGSISYMKFTKSGDWIYGRDDDEIDGDMVLAVNPSSFVIGWQGWQDGKPVDGPVVPFSQRQTLPMEAALPEIPVGDMNGWSKILGVTFKSMAEGLTIQFNTSSHGGKTAISKLMKDVGAGLQEHPEAPIALVTLSGDSYKHSKYGLIHTPEINVVGWADASGKKVDALSVA